MNQSFDWIAGEGEWMKYKPRHSNFEELQNEIVEDLLSVGNKIEDIKDAVAEQIDSFVEAILKEHVEEVSAWWIPGNEDCPMDIIFSAGSKILPDGTEDLFSRHIPLTVLLDDFDLWDEMRDFESQSLTKLADRIQLFVDGLREVARKAEAEEAKFDTNQHTNS